MTIQHSALTGSDLHEPKGTATASSGEVYTADGAGSGSWTNPLTNVNNLNGFDLNGKIDDISTVNSSYYIRIARDCELNSIKAVMSAAITGSDAEVTLYRDGIALAQTLSVPVSGSGDGVTVTLNLSPVYTFTSGQVLKLETNGASTDASSLFFTCEFAAT